MQQQAVGRVWVVVVDGRAGTVLRTQRTEEHAPRLINAGRIASVALFQLFDVRHARAVVEAVLELGQRHLWRGGGTFHTPLCDRRADTARRVHMITILCMCHLTGSGTSATGADVVSTRAQVLPCCQLARERASWRPADAAKRHNVMFQSI